MNKKPEVATIFPLYNKKKVHNTKNAFTLIEILVVITIIRILVIWLSKIDLSKWQEYQKSLAFSQKIQNILETTRNNSLVWRGIWTSLIVPNSWKIEISKNWWNIWWIGSINVFYNTWWAPIPNESLKREKYYEISKIECFDISWNSVWEISWSGTIYMTGSDISTNCPNNWKIIKIYTNYKKAFQNIINFNSVSWVIEKN